jgi:glycine oxidase
VASGQEIVIIGAGIIGCAVARELACRGASVHVVDARAVARGATWASAGMLAPYLEAAHEGVLLDIAVRSLALYDSWIADVRADSAMEIEYRRSGSLQVAMDPAAAARLEASAGGTGTAQVSWIDARQLHEIEPALSSSALGAVSVPTHGYVAAADLAAALARAASGRGARFHFGARVSSVDPAASHVTVTAEDGRTWHADQVVIAAGSWTGQIRGLSDPAASHVRPVRGQLLRLAWQEAALSGVVWGPSCYVVPWQDGTVLVGATMEEVGFEERNTAGAVRSLLEAARIILPHVDDATFLEARAGLRPATPDGLPFIGPSATSGRVTYATGHYRNGILLAPLTARLVCDSMFDSGADPLLRTLTPARIGA